ncbi:VanW family protein [Paenibacillus senegalensis]|uniref:VanW family protein n=1 Tax=Paenibacillus senegalensis TaxID=1465766 RepID=UPI000288832A|nr:VanW family protein [Paenibacillus senegalensis]
MKWISLTGIWLSIGLLIIQAGGMLHHDSSEDRLNLKKGEETIASVTRSDLSYTAFPLLDEEKLEQWLQHVHDQVYREPINAAIGSGGELRPGENGQGLDKERMSEQIKAFFYSRGSAEIQIPIIILYPKVDSELLLTIMEKPIGSYVTYFNSRNKNRAHNIVLAAKAINNAVLFPGESFSFNGTVGMRTAEKGYVRAPIIVRGELSEGIGGGICQVSSTLFNAIDRAGLKIVERYSHSRHVAYVPPGRDATVSWGGPDFVFSNPYNQPILIRTWVNGGMVTVSIFSSETIQHSPRVVPGASQDVPEEIKDGAIEKAG